VIGRVRAAAGGAVAAGLASALCCAGPLVAVAAGAAGIRPLCRGASAGTPLLAAQEAQAADTAVARFTVTGMTCGSCATTARVALQRLTGVYRATVSYDSSSAIVQYDPRRTSPDRIADQLVRMTGYRATLVTDRNAVVSRP